MQAEQQQGISCTCQLGHLLKVRLLCLSITPSCTLLLLYSARTSLLQL
jgi:hypothetical protein